MRKDLVLRRLIGAAVGVIITLIAIPATRWIVITQMGYLIGICHGTPGLSYDPSQVADRAPGEYAPQLAAAIRGQPGWHNSWASARVSRLRALAGRFPNNPSVYANLLRAESASIRYAGPAEFIITGQLPVPKRYQQIQLTGSAAQLVELQADAAAGERLDPNNAFFPFMSATGMFAVGDDAGAIVALHQAAGCTAWREFYIDEAVGDRRLNRLANGADVGLADLSTSGGVLLPHYSLLNMASRHAAYDAMMKETNGDPEAGLAIRWDLLRLGSLMRSQSTSPVGQIVGCNIAHTASLRPAGAPALLNAYGGDGIHASADHIRTEQQFLSYLDRIGRPADVAPVSAEFQAIKDVQYQIKGDGAGEAFDFRPLRTITVYWLIASMLLGVIIWCFVGALIAKTVSATKLPGAVGLSGQQWRAVGSIIAACIGISLVGIIVLGQANTIAAAIKSIDLISMNSNKDLLDPKSSYGVPFGFYVVAPALLCAWLAAFIARRLSAPVIPAVYRATTTFACLLVFVYAGMVLATVRADRTLENIVTKTWFQDPSSIVSANNVSMPSRTVWPENP